MSRHKHETPPAEVLVLVIIGAAFASILLQGFGITGSALPSVS